MATKENTSTKRTSAAVLPEAMSPVPTLDDFSYIATDAAASAAVGFGFLSTIIASVGELAKSDPELACRLAMAGQYWADELEYEALGFQDKIEQMQEGGAA
jgi:hypothetical protein